MGNVHNMVMGTHNEELKIQKSTHANPNLLKNWYFPNPINQLGDVSGDKTDWTYFIDGWLGFGHHIDYTVDGLAISVRDSGGYCSIMQRLDNVQWLIGRTVTVSALIDDQLFWTSGIFHTTPFSLPINGGSSRIEVGYYSDSALGLVQYYGGEAHTMKAIKLESGPVQTLAHQEENGNWILNAPPPDRALELVKCQRYQLSISYNARASGAINNGIGQIFVPTPVTMRRLPTLRLTSSSAGVFWHSKGATAVETITPMELSSNGVVCTIKSNDASVISSGSFGECAFVLDANL